MSIKIIYSDEQILVLDKPPGLVVLSAETVKVNTLEDILREEFKISLERAGVVHRLDKDTSGILVVAKTKKAYSTLQDQFKLRLVKKEYKALIHSHLREEKEVIAPLGRNPGNREKFTVLEGGKEAITKFVPIQLLVMSDEFRDKIFADFSKIQRKKLLTMNYSRFTLLHCFPLTGRTHQIRVHLKYINLSVVADDKYGGRKMTRLDHRFCERQFLHASKLTLMHPITKKSMIFESPLPDDLKKALNCLTNAQ